MNWLAAFLGFAFFLPAAALAQTPAQTAEQTGYRWERLIEHAAFPQSYNFPVMTTPDGRFLMLHPQGTWESRDGKTWTASALPKSGMNSAYMHYVQHRGAIYALGKHTGQGFDVTVEPTVQRTADFKAWEQLGRSDTLPKRFFFGAASYKDWIWMVGGRAGPLLDGAVWRSRDGLKWERAPGGMPFGAKERPQMLVFKDRLWVIGGGGNGEVWSTDGETWRMETRSLANPEPFGYSAVVFDGKIWLVGANRSGGFTSSSLVSADGKTWAAVNAPWTPRGAVAVWTDGRALYMTGGKYSRPTANGGQEFIYSNDVWKMTRAR